jgi:hypothetical protein
MDVYRNRGKEEADKRCAQNYTVEEKMNKI